MLGVEIEFGNDWKRFEKSSYKPTKAKTPARTQGFQNSVLARGGIDHGRWAFDSAY
jgi:hypothetical protein